MTDSHNPKKITEIPESINQKEYSPDKDSSVKNQPPEALELSFFRQLLNYLGLNKPPDTTDELEQEIHDLVEEGAEHGLISPHESKMINSILGIRDTLAKEIMTPKSEIISAPDSVSVQQVKELIEQHGFSRIPVYSGTPDHIIGMLHAKDLLKYCFAEVPPPEVSKCLKPVYVVPEYHKIIDLLKEFQTRKTHLAMVADEFGTIRGLITLEDVLEEIVGEITDEHDQFIPSFKALNTRTIVTDAKVDIEHIEAFYKIKLPKGPHESIGGMVIHQLGKIPGTGTQVTINGLSIKVIAATNRRVSLLRIQRVGA
jgi:CBS domain containing-hemolysin-like protein